MNDLVSRWRASFLTGLAIALPAVISIAVVRWLFGTISNVTDTLLILVPREWTHARDGDGQMYWYWSLCALVLAAILITLLGRLARNYLGRRLIKIVDDTLLAVPLLNKIYGMVKQVNEAFTSGKKSSFKQVVLVEFPRAGQFSVGFLTGERQQGLPARTDGNLVSVFVPTTPNPTSGFLVMLPENEVTKLDMSVADGLKFIISLGAIAPEAPPAAGLKRE
ncbi:MAG: DUF502 domain-containing protein [Verrucomicrobia bacterium]|nr:DUF502 domain-containing protein [Verrucomicrobiota bacterium]